MLILGFSTSLFACSHHPVSGIITMVDSKDMEIKSTDGNTVSILVRSGTKYLKGKTRVTASDLSVGIRVEVDVDTEGDRLVAREVRIGTAPAKRDVQKP